MQRFVVMAIAVGVVAAPAAAQNIGDIGRALQQQVMPRQGPDPRQEERDRAIYEQGRRDSERSGDRRRLEERRVDEQHRDARRREDAYNRSEQNRRRVDEDRARDEEQRVRTGRY